MCEMDIDDGNTMNKKIRNAQLAQYNFIFGESQFLVIVSLLLVSSYLFGCLLLYYNAILRII